jgi:hypothetical protein
MSRRIMEWEDWTGETTGELDEIPGQLVTLSRDQEKIMAEIRQRALWADMAPDVENKQQVLLADLRGNGVDFFAWIDEPAPGGFLWVALPGAKQDSAAFNAVRDWIMTCLGWDGARVIRTKGGVR